jgi:hypothetical protein
MKILDQEVLNNVMRSVRTATLHGARKADTFAERKSLRTHSPEIADELAIRTVWLHVYDLNATLKYLLNHWMFSRLAGLGAFHCGIEVLGAEWSFQADPLQDEGGADTTGLMCMPPKGHPVHLYRESVLLGISTLGVRDIWQVLLNLEQQWPAQSYHALQNNCTDFAEAFARALLVPEPFPNWVKGIAKGYLIHTPFANSGADRTLPRSWMSRSVQSECRSQLIESADLQRGAENQQESNQSYDDVLPVPDAPKKHKTEDNIFVSCVARTKDDEELPRVALRPPPPERLETPRGQANSEWQGCCSCFMWLFRKAEAPRRQEPGGPGHRRRALDRMRSEAQSDEAKPLSETVVLRSTIL